MMMFEEASVAEAETAWAVRCEHWTEQATNAKRPRSPRRRNAEPLILSGHGMSLKIDRGALVVRNGFTHHPQTNEPLRFFPGDLDNPERIVVLDGSGSLSFDLLSWLSEQGVSLIRINWKGEAICVVAGTGYAADQSKIDWQRQTRENPVARLEFSNDLIARKLEASLKTLLEVVPCTSLTDKAIDKVAECRAELRSKAHDIDRLRGIEGRAARPYFGAWAGIEMSWKSEARRPVPPAWREYQQRSSVLSGVKGQNWKAAHPINAMLNYAYGVLESRLRMFALANGYDPCLGIYHHGRRGSSAYVFDLMEPHRPEVDREVLKFALSETFSAADFVLRKDGVCRLSPPLATRIVQLVSI